MKRAFKIGFSFGLPSGIVTTLGLMVGLNSTTHSQFVVIGGILTIAIADALSDSMGMHFAQESESHLSHKDIWKTTLFTFIAKFIFSFIFIFPILLLDLNTAIIICVMIGMYLIFITSLIIARERKDNPYTVIISHLVLTFIVILIANYVGVLISNTFGCS